MPSTYSIGWFSTGRDEAARNLLAHVQRKMREGYLDIKMPFVFCNYRPGEDHRDSRERERFFDLAETFDMEILALPWRWYRDQFGEDWRHEYGKDMAKILPDTDLDVLAGYMLWLDDMTCNTRKAINLHPARPGGPVGTWQQVIWQVIGDALEGRTEFVQGAQMQRVTPEWDKGPTISYFEFPIDGDEYGELWVPLEDEGVIPLDEDGVDYIRKNEGEKNPLFRRIREDGEIRELPLIVETIKAFSDGKVWINEKGEVTTEDGILDKGYDLTRQVEEVIRRKENGRKKRDG